MAREAPVTKTKKQRINTKRSANDIRATFSTSSDESSAGIKAKKSVRSLSASKEHGSHLHLSPDMFPKLLGPISPDAFLREHYHTKSPLLIKGHNFVPFLDEEMEGGDILGLLESSPSENISVWTVTGPAQKINTARVQDAGSAAALYVAGHSVYCRAPEAVESVLVESAIGALGLGCRMSQPGVKSVIEGEVEMFLSHAGHHTPFHFDFQENVTLQLKGRKRWRLKKGVKNPVRGCTPHYRQVDGVLDAAGEEQVKVHRLRDSHFVFQGPKEDEEEEMVVMVEEGDVFYHPAGVWHAVECLEESISINVSLDGMTYADLFSGALKQVLWGEEDGRFTAMVATGDGSAKDGGKEGGKDDSRRQRKQKQQKRQEDVTEKPQARMRRLLLEASERFKVLAERPEALLPPCVWWNSGLPPMKDAAAAPYEKGEEAEEGEGDEGGDGEEEEEGDDDFHCKDFAVPVGEDVWLCRNPLASFFRLDDVVAVKEVEEDKRGVDEDEEEEEEEFMVHVGFGGTEDLSSVFRKKMWVPRHVGVFVAGLPTTREGGRFQLEQFAGKSKEQTGRVLGALIHTGVLLRDKE
ncbi:Hypothetical protein NocV09_01200490 [Nannochloropsis oceanica]